MGGGGLFSSYFYEFSLHDAGFKLNLLQPLNLVEEGASAQHYVHVVLLAQTEEINLNKKSYTGEISKRVPMISD